VPVAVRNSGRGPVPMGISVATRRTCVAACCSAYSALLQRVVARSTVPMGKWVDDELPKLAPHDRPIEVVQEEGDLL
jgi:hypothetical protein